MSMKHTHGIGSRCASLFLSVMLLVAMAIVPASAENGGVIDNKEGVISSIPVSLVINTDGNTYAPSTEFEIAVSTGAKGAYNDGTSQVTVNAGISGGLSGCTITSAPDTQKEPSASYTLQGNLTVNLTAFTGATPGIYHYEVREKAGSYEGITYDSKTYDVYLYLMRTAGNELYIGYAVCVDSGTDAKAALTFTNDYGKTNDTTHDFPSRSMEPLARFTRLCIPRAVLWRQLLLLPAAQLIWIRLAMTIPFIFMACPQQIPTR